MIELLNRFVANSSEPREYMRAPFTRGDWTYATNGHIAVRVPKIDGMEILPDKHAPKLEGLFESVCFDACIGLPGARFSPGAGPMDCAWFVFDGGEGVLMPRRDLAPPVLVHAAPG